MEPRIPGRAVVLTGRNSLPDYLRKIASKARKEGWVTAMNGDTHIVFLGPDGQRVICGGSIHPNGRSMKNTMVALRKAGVPGAERPGSPKKKKS